MIEAVTAASVIGRAATALLDSYVAAKGNGGDGETQLAPEDEEMVEDAIATGTRERKPRAPSAPPRRGRARARVIEPTITATPVMVGTALALDSDTVFSDSRKRMSLTFKLNVLICTALAFVLLLGIVGAFISAMAGLSRWTLIFGGVSAADLIGSLFFKPLERISTSQRETARLEILIAGTRDGLQGCQAQPSKIKRAECAQLVWQRALKEIGPA